MCCCLQIQYVSVEVEVKLRPTVSRPARLGVRHPSGTRDQFFFLLEIFFIQLRVCYFVAPSLTRGRVCNLLLLPPTWRARSPYLYPPGTGWPRYTPGHWVPFPSPLTTLRRYSIPPPHGILARAWKMYFIEFVWHNRHKSTFCFTNQS
jgi:hypothetical protein